MLEISGEVCFRRCPQTFFRVSGEDSTVIITIFCIVCFEAVTCGLREVSVNLLKCALVSGISAGFCLITTSKNSLSEIHTSRPTPQDSIS